MKDKDVFFPGLKIDDVWEHLGNVGKGLLSFAFLALLLFALFGWIFVITIKAFSKQGMKRSLKEAL